MLELAGPKELVVIRENEKVKAGPRNYLRSLLGIHARAANNMADVTTKLSNVTPTFLRDFLTPEAKDTQCLKDLEEGFVFILDANERK